MREYERENRMALKNVLYRSRSVQEFKNITTHMKQKFLNIKTYNCKVTGNRINNSMV